MIENHRPIEETVVELDPSWSPLRRVMFGIIVLVILLAAATPFILGYGDPVVSAPQALPDLPDVDLPDVCRNSGMPASPNRLIDMFNILVRRACG